MAFNGSGTFVRSHNWVTDKTNVVPVTASRMDTECDGFATGLSTCLAKDGQQTATARIPFALGISSMAGSVSSASFAQISDLNTGLYFPAVDQWGLTAGGVLTLSSTATTITTAVGVLVTGDLIASDDLECADDLRVFGDVLVNTNQFTVDGANGNTVVAGTLGVAGNVAVATNKFTVAAASGNTVVAGTLGVTGASSLAAVTATTIGGTAITASAALSGATAAGAMLATQAEQETGTATDKLVTPGTQHFHPGAAKAWGSVTFSGGATPTLATGTGQKFNVASITDTNTGQTDITFTTAMSSAVYCVQATFQQAPTLISHICITNKGTTGFRVRTLTAANSASTSTSAFDADFDFVVYGDL